MVIGHKTIFFYSLVVWTSLPNPTKFCQSLLIFEGTDVLPRSSKTFVCQTSKINRNVRQSIQWISKASRHAQYYKMLLVLRSLNELPGKTIATRLRSALVRKKDFIATLHERGVRLKAETAGYVQKSQKRWIKRSSIRSKYVQDLLAEIV